MLTHVLFQNHTTQYHLRMCSTIINDIIQNDTILTSLHTVSISVVGLKYYFKLFVISKKVFYILQKNLKEAKSTH